MPRRLLGVFLLLLVPVLVGRAQGDVVLLTVGKDSVSRSEYIYHLHGTSEKHGHVFAQTLARFKQKVQAARELGLDTIMSYRQEVEYFRGLLEKQGQSAERRRNTGSAKEWIKLVHITCPLAQHADKRQEREAQRILDSLYVSLAEGKGDARLETMPWVQTRYLLDEWKAQLMTLDRGVYSKPFRSPLGIHIVAWTDKREGEVSGEIAPTDARKFRLQEMEEGLLVSSLEHYLGRTTTCTESDLEDYFRNHRTDYGWGTPYYRGVVIYCQNKKEAQRIKKYLKKYPERLWTEAWKRMPSEVSENCQLEIGLFAIGENPYVDKLVFKCGAFEALEGFPYIEVFGKKLKKGPSVYTDVREKVEKDCRTYKKMAQMEALMGKYKVEIDEEVLKTVNHERNK